MAATRKTEKRPERAAIDPRAARRERRRDRSRGEILEAARTVLLRSGVAAMTLDAVATEAGMSKTGLYYYFPSKDALVFELVHDVIAGQVAAVHDAVETAADGGAALRAIIRETVKRFSGRLDDFRLAFFFGQVAGAGAVRWTPEQFARLRPLNDTLLGGAERLLAAERRKRAPRARVEPRLLAFLAYLAAIGLLTMKGMVEQMDDPLRFSDDELAEAMARVFEAAAG